MKFETTTIRGHGRGRTLGFPTINLLPPPELALTLTDGIYAVWVAVGKERYPGALFWGPIPVFGERERSLEIYLIDAVQFYLGTEETVSFEVVKYIRPVMNFSSSELLTLQITKDVSEIKKVLHI